MAFPFETSHQPSQTATKPATPETLPVILYHDVRVITTDLLAQVYGVEPENIQDNYRKNADRFTGGKHFFKLEGEELRRFKDMHRVGFNDSVEPDYPETFRLVDRRARHLTLWTERGAARHAKMINTDQAWDVFERLEDAYFKPRETQPQPAAQFPLFLTPEQFTASFHETIRDSVYKAFRGSSRGLIRAEVNKALADQQEAVQDLVEQAVRDGINATFMTIGEAVHGQQAQPVRPAPIPPGQIEEGRYAVQRAQARERHHQDLRVEAVSGGTWKGYLRRHNIGRLFTREERQVLKAEFYQLQQSCRPLAA